VILHAPSPLSYFTTHLYCTTAYLLAAIDQLAVTYKVKHPQPTQCVFISYFCQYQVLST